MALIRYLCFPLVSGLVAISLLWAQPAFAQAQPALGPVGENHVTDDAPQEASEELVPEDTDDVPAETAEPALEVTPESPAQEAPTVLVTDDPADALPAAPAPALDTESSSGWLYVLLFLLTIVAGAAIGIAFYLYRFRFLFLSNNPTVAPERLYSWVKSLSKDFKTVSSLLEDSSKSARQSSDELLKKQSELSDSIFSTLQNALDKREKEIDRLKGGYDARLFKNFVRRFIMVRIALDEYAGTGADANLNSIVSFLDSALAECGVQRFRPNVGDNYFDAIGVAKPPVEITTSDPSQENTIAEVLADGFKLSAGETVDIVIEAKVSVYKMGGRQ